MQKLLKCCQHKSNILFHPINSGNLTFPIVAAFLQEIEKKNCKAVKCAVNGFDPKKINPPYLL